jgi:hypothetical protein
VPFKDLVLKCAWCGRYRIGDDWLDLGVDDAPDPDRATHGICSDCLRALRMNGETK